MKLLTRWEGNSFIRHLLSNAKKSIGLARVDQTVEKSGLVKIRNKELEIEFVSQIPKKI